MSGCVTSCGPCTGVRGLPAPVVEFLPGASAALIESIPGQVHNVEGIHGCPASGSSSAAALLNPVNPSIATISMRSRQVWGWEASQVLKTPLGSARDHV